MVESEKSFRLVEGEAPAGHFPVQKKVAVLKKFYGAAGDTRSMQSKLDTLVADLRGAWGAQHSDDLPARNQTGEAVFSSNADPAHVPEGAGVKARLEAAMAAARLAKASRSRRYYCAAFEELPDFPEYSQAIKNPISLSCIDKKIEASEYSEISAFRDDVRLLQDNCFAFAHANGGCALHTDCKAKTQRPGNNAANKKLFGVGHCHCADLEKVVAAMEKVLGGG